MQNGEWISVDSKVSDLHETYKDSPRTSGDVLTFNGTFVSIGRYEETYTNRSLRWLNKWNRVEKVTHWMPLPEKPHVEDL